LSEHVIADLPYYVVETLQGFGDALRGDVGGQAVATSSAQADAVLSASRRKGAKL
jgi:hypothetical protein